MVATVTDTNYYSSALGLLVIGLSPLHIVDQPLSKTVLIGQTVVLSVTAEGTGPISYQWKKGTVKVAGATNATLTIPNAAASDAGKYSAVVSNSKTTLTSATATVTVVTPVKINAQPTSLTRSVGQRAQFDVTATGTGPLTYQWRKDTGAITGATSPTLTLTNVHAVNAGSYSVVVTNAAGSVTSATATLTIH